MAIKSERRVRATICAYKSAKYASFCQLRSQTAASIALQLIEFEKRVRAARRYGGTFCVYVGAVMLGESR